jgi:hypothetical protein
MAKLFMGSGLESFNNSGLGEREFGGGDGFCRQEVDLGFATAQYAETPAWSAVQELWVHYNVTVLDYGANDDILQWSDGTDVVFKLHTVSGTPRFSYLSGVATYTQIGSDVTLIEGAYFDIYFKSGASGEVGFYINGVEQMTASASMTYATDVTKVIWQRLTGGNHRFGSVLIDEDNTIGVRVAQGYPSGNGANTAWAGDYTSVDEQYLSEADYIYSNTANQVETYTQTLVQSISGYTIDAVSVNARIKRGS